jgi:hypothetical protein
MRPHLIQRLVSIGHVPYHRHDRAKPDEKLKGTIHD